MTDCVVTRIDKAIMVATLRDEPKLSELFLAFVLARDARVEEDLVDQLFIQAMLYDNSYLRAAEED
jgi:hypothetical protein